VTDLIERLRSMARFEHDDHSIGSEAADEIERLLDQRDSMLAAAQAVVDRWDSPLWANLPHTGEFIARLRTSIVKATKGKS